MPQPFSFDVFLSHNSADKPRVRKLAERLKKAGLRVWFDDWIIRPGSDIYLAVERGLENSRTLVLCMSKAAFEAKWVTLERSTSLFRDPDNEDRRFVPLLLTDCKIPDTLRRYKYVDYREETDEAFDELLNACQDGLNPPKESITDRTPGASLPTPASPPTIGSAAGPRPTDRSLDGNWVAIPSGDYWMGAQKTDPKGRNYDSEAFDDEAPVHLVRHGAYRISRYEVTVAQHQRFVDAGGYAKEAHWKAGGFGQWPRPDKWDEQLQHPDCPVTGVSWYEASAYAAWAGCRLPTEAEWERVARGTEARRYPWGDGKPNPELLNYAESKIGQPTPVGVCPRGATPDGILDMAGNVWEWCLDVWHANYKSAPSDGSAWTTGSDSNSRVLRGGPWDAPGACRSVYRDRGRPDDRGDDFGFRVAYGT